MKNKKNRFKLLHRITSYQAIARFAKHAALLPKVQGVNFETSRSYCMLCSFFKFDLWSQSLIYIDIQVDRLSVMDTVILGGKGAGRRSISSARDDVGLRSRFFVFAFNFNFFLTL